MKPRSDELSSISHIFSKVSKIKKSGKKSVFSSFAIFCKGYKTRFYFWESLILLRKFLLCFMVTLNSSILDENQWFLIIILFLFFLFATVKYMPFEINRVNFCETNSLLICVFSSIACFSFTSKSFPVLNETLCYIMILINLFFFIHMAYILSVNYMKYLKKIKVSLSNKLKSRINQKSTLSVIKSNKKK